MTKLIKYIENDIKLDIKEEYIYDINNNPHKIKDTTKSEAFISLFLNSEKRISFHIYNNPLLSHILHERNLNNDIIGIRLRKESDFNAKILNEKYVHYKHLIITVSN